MLKILKDKRTASQIAEARDIAIMSSGDEMVETHTTKFAGLTLEAKYEAAQKAQDALSIQYGLDVSIKDVKGVSGKGVRTNP